MIVFFQDEAQKLANKDLQVAQIILEMTLERNGERNERSLQDITPLNETKLQHLNQLAEKALSINPLNVDPLVSGTEFFLYFFKFRYLLVVTY